MLFIRDCLKYNSPNVEILVFSPVLPQTPKSMRKPTLFVLLPASCSLVRRLSCSLVCLQPQLLRRRQSPALHRGAGQALIFGSVHGFLAALCTEQRQRTRYAFFLTWVISKDPKHPRHGQNSGVQRLSHFRPLCLPEHLGDTKHWVIQDPTTSPYTCGAGEAMLSTRENASSGTFLGAQHDQKGQDWCGLIWNSSTLPWVTEGVS